jgi:hypothetical protein
MSKATDIHFRLHTNRQGPVMPGMTTPCWLWTGAITGGGRGKLKPNGKIVKAYRYAWQYHGHPLPPPDLDFHHICGNKLCVNPDHLAVVTPTGHTELERILKEVIKCCGHC